MARGVPWSAITVPEIRRQWCNAVDATAAMRSQALDTPDEHNTGAKRLARMQAKLADAIEQMRVEADTLREAPLFWVERDVVDRTCTRYTTHWSPASQRTEFHSYSTAGPV
jgi:hypothetical protein